MFHAEYARHWSSSEEAKYSDQNRFCCNIGMPDQNVTQRRCFANTSQNTTKSSSRVLESPIRKSKNRPRVSKKKAATSRIFSYDEKL